jgi:hypothetical protein
MAAPSEPACRRRAVARFAGLDRFWVDDHFVPAEHVHLGVAISLRNADEGQPDRSGKPE